jgi:hypothetical protein
VRRPAAHVDGDVEDRAADAAHQLAERLAELRVLPRRCPAPAQWLSCTNGRRDPGLPVLGRMVRLEEETACVAAHDRLDEQHLGQFGRTNLHRQPCSRTRRR